MRPSIDAFLLDSKSTFSSRDIVVWSSMKGHSSRSLVKRLSLFESFWCCIPYFDISEGKTPNQRAFGTANWSATWQLFCNPMQCIKRTIRCLWWSHGGSESVGQHDFNTVDVCVDENKNGERHHV